MTDYITGNKLQKSLGDLLWNVFFTITTIFINDYKFGCGDLEEHIPQVYKKLHPELYPYDYFVVPATSHFTVRTVYVNTISFLAQLLSVPTVCFLLYFICTFLIVVYTRKITAFFFKDRYSSFLAPMLVLIFFQSWTIGFNQILDFELTCSVFASTFSVIALYYFFKEKYLITGLLLGAATLYQLLEGLQLYLVLLTILILIPGDKKGQKLGKISVGYIVAGAFTLIPIFYRQFFMPQPKADLARFYEIYIGLYDGHYKASAAPLRNYVQELSLIIVAIGLLIANKSDKLRFFVTMFGVIAGGCLVYYCATELLHWNAIYKLQWLKTTIWISFFCLVIIAGYLGDFLSRYLKINPYQPVVMALLACVLIWQSLFVYSVPGIIRKSWAGKYMIGPYYPKNDLTLMHEWIEKNTPTDAIILSMPFDVSVLCETKRSTAIGSRAIIHEPDFYLHWWDHFASIYSVDTCAPGTPYLQRFFQSTANYKKETNAELARKCRFDYRITRSGTPGSAADTLQIIHTEGIYVLIKNNFK